MAEEHEHGHQEYLGVGGGGEEVGEGGGDEDSQELSCSLKHTVDSRFTTILYLIICLDKAVIFSVFQIKCVFKIIATDPGIL